MYIYMQKKKVQLFTETTHKFNKYQNPHSENAIMKHWNRDTVTTSTRSTRQDTTITIKQCYLLLPTYFNFPNQTSKLKDKVKRLKTQVAAYLL